MAAEPSATSIPRASAAWWFLPALVGAAFVTAYWPTLVALNARWLLFDEAYSHGYLVLGMVGYFAWLQADRLRRAAVRSNLRAIVVVAALSMLWALGRIVDVQLVGAVSLPLIALAVVYALYGWQVARILAFPILLVYVAIPLWEDLFTIPLREVTTSVAMVVLDNFASFPAHRDGFAIAIPEGVFFVADGCSGLSFLLTGITIGLGYGYLNIDGLARRTAYFFVCVALSIVSNWVRVTSLVYIGHYTHMQSELVTSGHLMYGWFVFAAVMVLMLVIGYRLSAPLPAEAATASTSADDAPRTPATRALVGVVFAMLLAPALVFAYRALPSKAVAPPTLPSEFVASAPASAEWRGFFHGASVELDGALIIDPALRVVVYHYPAQTQEAELINDINRLVDEPDWNSLGAQRIAAGEVAGLPHSVIEEEFDASSGSRVLVWHWYDLGGHLATGRLDGKLAQLRAALFAGRSDGTFFALSLRCSTDCVDARARMRELAPSRLASFGRASEGSNTTSATTGSPATQP